MSDQLLSRILDELKGINNRLDNLESTARGTNDESRQDIIGKLTEINAKLEEKDYEVQALNKRLFTVESMIEMMSTEGR